MNLSLPKPCTSHLAGSLGTPRIICSYQKLDGTINTDDVSFPVCKLPNKGTNLLSGYSSSSSISDPSAAEETPCILTAINQKNIPWNSYHFVSYRNTISRIAMLSYLSDDTFSAFAVKHNNTVFFGMIHSPTRVVNENHRRSMYIGRQVERVMLNQQRDASFVNLVETFFIGNNHQNPIKILIACETDCIDGNGKFTEIKTAHTNSKSSNYTKCEKAMKTFVQSALGGVSQILTIYHSNGIVSGSELRDVNYYPTLCRRLPRTTEFNNVREWDPRRIFGTGEYVLGWIHSRMVEETVYRFSVLNGTVCLEEDSSDEGRGFADNVEKVVKEKK
ncbi:hypothetical protein GEMRC1_004902 [Eukaryota sp. GEM-RC1]